MSRVAAALLPSFGLVVFAVTLFHVLFLARGTETLFRDSDTGWHIRNGEAIWDSGAVPRVDRFSYTRQGSPWFAWEWLSDLAFGVAHRAAGLAGVAFLAALSISLTAWAVARAALFMGGNFFLTAAAMVVLLSVTSIHWMARPHIFSWPMSLLFLVAAESERQRPGRILYGMPPAACLWANLHGSFLVGPVILFLYALEEAWRNRSPQKLWNRFAAAGVVSLGATLFNPYGWELHRHIFAYLRNHYLMDHIAEFRSFSFHSPGAFYVELFLVGAILCVPVMGGQGRWAAVLLTLGMLHLSLFSARHLPMAAVLVLPLMAAALTQEARRRSTLLSLINYSERLLQIDRRVRGLVPLAAVICAALLGLGASERAGRLGFSPGKFPVEAARFLEASGRNDRLFTKDQWGGYLIYRFNGRTQVFLDGRSDFYGREMLETYARVMEVKPGWESVLKEYKVGLVLTAPDQPLAAVLHLSPEWKRIHEDPVAVVFERSA